MLLAFLYADRFTLAKSQDLFRSNPSNPQNYGYARHMTRPSFRLLTYAWVAIVAGCTTLRMPSAVFFEVQSPATTSPLHFSLSPDGQDLVAFMTAGEGVALWSRPLGKLEGLKVPGTDRARGGASGFPFWSPDSASIGSFGNRSLQVMDRKGGTLRTLAPAPFAHGGTWNSRGVIVYAPNENGPLYRIDAAGGTPRQVTSLNPSRQETAHRHPYFLPDGRHFLYVAVTPSPENSGIWIGSLDSAETRFLVSSTVKAVFAPPATILYVQGVSLMARAFDAKRLIFTGAPRLLVDSIATNQRNSAAGFAVSSNGVLAYLKRRTESGPAPETIPIIVVMNWPELYP